MSSDPSMQIVNFDSERTFAALFSGFVLSTILYGLTFFQTYVYFSRFARDAFWLRILVALLWALDTTATGLTSKSLYTYLITDFGIPFSALTTSTTLCTAHVFTTITIFLVQAYYAVRTYEVSKRNWVISSMIAVLSVATFITGIVSTVQIFRHRSITAFATSTLKTPLSVHTALASAADILITLSLFIYLSPYRNEFVRLPSSWFEQAVTIIINRGVITFVVQFVYFLAFVSNPSAQIWVPFPIFIGKVYVNVLLVWINYRSAQSSRGIDEGSAPPVNFNDSKDTGTASSPSGAPRRTHSRSGLIFAKSRRTGTPEASFGTYESALVDTKSKYVQDTGDAQTPASAAMSSSFDVYKADEPIALTRLDSYVSNEEGDRVMPLQPRKGADNQSVESQYSEMPAPGLSVPSSARPTSAPSVDDQVLDVSKAGIAW